MATTILNSNAVNIFIFIIIIRNITRSMIVYILLNYCNIFLWIYNNILKRTNKYLFITNYSYNLNNQFVT
jgi:hypothetical protein